jgi:hypothetical protein
MFIGHFAVAFGAKRFAPRLSLGTLFLAAQWLDLLWPTLLLLGVERVRIDPGNTAFTPLDFVAYPLSHGLLAVVVQALVFGALVRWVSGSRRNGFVAGALVVSHWLLDLLTHRPDLPLLPGSETRVGLGLWNSVPATVVVEVGLFVVALWIYVRTTEPRDRIGSIGLGALAAFLLLIYAGNLFGPPPPDVPTIAWAGQAQWLIVLWGYWIDRHREPRTATAAS